MKTMKITNIVFATLGATLFFVSCSKDGEDGAIGPQGPQGEQGMVGPAGAPGEQGETGTANVIYSDWIPANFILAGAQQSNFMGLEVFSDAELNPDTDLVLVYGQRATLAGSDTDGIYPLPFILPSQDEYYGFGLFETTGGIGLQVRVSTLDGGSNQFSFFTEYKYVIIPGGVSASGKSSNSLDYGKMSYDEVIVHFNIPK